MPFLACDEHSPLRNCCCGHGLDMIEWFLLTAGPIRPNALGQRETSSLGGGPSRRAAVAAVPVMATGAGAGAAGASTTGAGAAAAGASASGAGAGAASGVRTSGAGASATGAGAAAATAGAGASSGLAIGASAGIGETGMSWPLAEPMRAARMRQRTTSTDEDPDPAILIVPVAARNLHRNQHHHTRLLQVLLDATACTAKMKRNTISPQRSSKLQLQ